MHTPGYGQSDFTHLCEELVRGLREHHPGCFVVYTPVTQFRLGARGAAEVRAAIEEMAETLLAARPAGPLLILGAMAGRDEERIRIEVRVAGSIPDLELPPLAASLARENGGSLATREWDEGSALVLTLYWAALGQGMPRESHGAGPRPVQSPV